MLKNILCFSNDTAAAGGCDGQQQCARTRSSSSARRRPAGFELTTSSTRVTSSTTALHSHMCSYSVFFIPYYTTPSQNLLFEGLNQVSLKSCQLQYFITFWNQQLSYWSFLCPRSFEKSKLSYLKNSKVATQTVRSSNRLCLGNSAAGSLLEPATLPNTLFTPSSMVKPTVMCSIKAVHFRTVCDDSLHNRFVQNRL